MENLQDCLSICIFVFSGNFDALLGLQEETTQRLCGLLSPEKIALKSPATLREEDGEKSEK